jgi:hypothetical protein
MQTLDQLLSGQLKGIVKLKLSCGLTEIPKEVFELAETLEVLDLSGNKLSSLPEAFVCLQKLKIVFFSNNRFTTLPEVLYKCTQLRMIGFKANQISFISEQTLPPNLRWLILTDNQLAAIPKSIGKCLQLQKLMLAGNKLTSLPVEMAACVQLQLLRIAANSIVELPSWLFKLPALSWLTFSGNPCCKAKNSNDHLPEISWTSFRIEEQLGEGASGNIYKAHWKDKQHVALKVFKGEVTSDGFPADEIAAWASAGSHPQLVKVLGKIPDHPEQKQGLVFELIPPSFKNLGLPPDFETCTRDRFQEGTIFSMQEILHIATGAAKAVKHLHLNHLMHGDLYAHNILYDASGNSLLGDFGAATHYSDSDTIPADALERIEVRAFGCMLEDLLQHLAPEDSNNEWVDSLTSLMQACLLTAVLERPDFASILTDLAFKEKN